MSELIYLDQNVDLSSYNVIIPCIGVGNVAQLAVDLIIATLKLKRIGSGWHSALMPIFGPPAYEHDDSKTTSMEIYCDEKKKLLVFQFRSPLVASRVDKFHTELLDFLGTHQVASIIILTSSHAYEKHSIESSSFEYLTNFLFLQKYEKEVKEQQWKEFQGTVIHGGGNASKLYKYCTDRGFSTLLLFKYVSEGDNTPDASHLVGELNRIYKIFDGTENTAGDGHLKFTTPTSWNLLFGNEPPELIF